MGNKSIHEAPLSADGSSEVVRMRAASARTKGDVVYMDMGITGLIDMSVGDDNTVHFAAVAAHDIASGEHGLYYVQGYCDAKIDSSGTTAVIGDGIDVLNGVVAPTDADFGSGGVAGEAQQTLGVVLETSSANEIVLICLHGKAFTAQT